MKKLILLLILSLVLLASPAMAQKRTTSDFISPLGYCQLTSVSASTLVSSCSGGIPQSTGWATLCVDTAAIRWRDDGTAPTASVGMPIAAGQCFYYSGTFATLRVIAQSGSPVVNISFYSGAPRQ